MHGMIASKFPTFMCWMYSICDAVCWNFYSVSMPKIVMDFLFLLHCIPRDLTHALWSRHSNLSKNLNLYLRPMFFGERLLFKELRCWKLSNARQSSHSLFLAQTFSYESISHVETYVWWIWIIRNIYQSFKDSELPLPSLTSQTNLLTMV